MRDVAGQHKDESPHISWLWFRLGNLKVLEGTVKKRELVRGNSETRPELLLPSCEVYRQVVSRVEFDPRRMRFEPTMV
jgi:hypothetical protein